MLLLLLTGSCGKDAKDVPATASANISGRFSFSNFGTWPQAYQVVLGTFNGDTTLPTRSVTIATPADSNNVYVRLTGIPSGTKEIRLCLVSSGVVLYTFYTYGYKGFQDSVMSDKNIALLSFNRVQNQVFTSHCITCHGGSSGSPAAGMYLTEGKAYTNLVNHAAVNSTKMRVLPYSTANSFVIDVLRLKGIGFTHSASQSISEENIQLLEAWIRDGAGN